MTSAEFSRSNEIYRAFEARLQGCGRRRQCSFALDDRYWGSIGTMTAAGVRVSPERALSLAAVYACVRVVSETLASFPLIIYRRIAGRRERAGD
jgi:hypothetical protein